MSLAYITSFTTISVPRWFLLRKTVPISICLNKNEYILLPLIIPTAGKHHCATPLHPFWSLLDRSRSTRALHCHWPGMRFSISESRQLRGIVLRAVSLTTERWCVHTCNYIWPWHRSGWSVSSRKFFGDRAKKTGERWRKHCMERPDVATRCHHKYDNAHLSYVT